MDKTYFLFENGQVSSPYTIEDLKHKSLTGDTMICEKFGAWKPVREIPELQDLWEWTPADPPQPDWVPPPVSAPNHEAAPANETERSDSGVTSRRPLIPASFGLAALCFFFVFCDLKCGEQKIASVTGMQFITGIEMKGMGLEEFGQSGSKKAPPNLWAMMALFVAVLGCGAYLVSKNTESAAGVFLGILGAAAMLALQVSVKTQFEKEGQGALIAEFQPAYWISLLAMIAAAIISGTLPSRSAKGNLSPPAEPPLPEQEVKAPPEQQESDELPPIVQLVEEVIPRQKGGGGIKLAVGLSSVLILIAAGYFFLVKPGLGSNGHIFGKTLLNGTSSPAASTSSQSNVEMLSNQFLKGDYTGTIGDKKFRLTIEKISGELVEGYNIAGDNRRPVKGRIENKWQTEAGQGSHYTIFKLRLNEPGDHKWDGVFNIDLWISDTESHGDGEWRSFDGKLVRAVKMNAMKTSNSTARNDPERTYSIAYVTGLDINPPGLMGIKEKLLPKMVKDGAIMQNCLNEVENFNEAVDIQEVELDLKGRQFVLSGGRCGMGTRMAMYWIYEIKQDKIRMLADLGAMDNVEISSISTNGYFDIITEGKASVDTFARVRMRFDGKKYVIADRQYFKYE